MTQSARQVTWHILGQTVRGAVHMRADRVNQDAIGMAPLGESTGSTNAAIIALADGHGGSKYLRSDIGAQWAVNSALKVLQNTVTALPQTTLSAYNHWANEHLPQELVSEWNDAIDAHLDSTPITTEEWTQLDKDDPTARLTLAKNRRILYGATLLIVLVTDMFILTAQLGDGDILFVADNGEVSRPLPKDARLFGNETTSLCTHKGWRDFRIGFQAIVGAPPALIVLATDGYANSFRSEAGFLQVGSDILEMIRSDGLESIRANLPDWLADSSRSGSGDDITVGLLYRVDAASVVNAETPLEQAPIQIKLQLISERTVANDASFIRKRFFGRLRDGD